jgi:hypothetical protein
MGELISAIIKIIAWGDMGDASLATILALIVAVILYYFFVARHAKSEINYRKKDNN